MPKVLHLISFTVPLKLLSKECTKYILAIINFKVWAHILVKHFMHLRNKKNLLFVPFNFGYTFTITFILYFELCLLLLIPLLLYTWRLQVFQLLHKTPQTFVGVQATHFQYLEFLNLLKCHIWSACCSGPIQTGCEILFHQQMKFSTEMENVCLQPKNQLKTSKEELPASEQQPHP